jgi:hypothetical protein
MVAISLPSFTTLLSRHWRENGVHFQINQKSTVRAMNSHAFITTTTTAKRFFSMMPGPAACLLAFAMLVAPHARASEDGFSPLFSGTLNGDFVVAGSYSRVFGAPVAQTDPFTVTLGGIPAGSSIVGAFANWTYLTDVPGDIDESAITINGNPVTGSVSSAVPDLGWGKSVSASYTADVTALVTGNGAFTIGSAIDEFVASSFGEGFSLLAVFRNPASPLNHVHVYSGFTSNTSNSLLKNSRSALEKLIWIG